MDTARLPNTSDRQGVSRSRCESRESPRTSDIDKRKLSRHVLAMTPNAPCSPPSTIRTVEILAYPAVQLLDVTGPLQVFASANDFMAKAGEAPPYEIRIVAPGGRSVDSSSGMTIVAHPLPPMEAGLDTLVIAGGEGIDAAVTDTVLVDWVRGRARLARRTASVAPELFC